MQIILLDKINSLGNPGDQISVKAGYARNFLIPQGKAVPATQKNVEYFETKRTELLNKLVNINSNAKARAAKIKELGSITISAKVGHEGKLFGSIGNRDIANKITSSGISVTRKEVRLPNGVLRTIGNHDVIIQLHGDIYVKLNVTIVSNT